MRSVLVGLLLLASCAKGRGPKNPFGDPVVDSQFDLDQTLPLASDIQTGTLDNGLSWFVRPNPTPPGRVQLRLAVDVGSVLEAENQRGYAHIVEHMAFNGTADYPGTSLVSWLEGQGIPFGVHINASTGMDQTVYSLQVPTDDPAVVDKAIGVLAQFAGQVTFDKVEADRERGVIIEEWRSGQGAQSEMMASAMGTLFEGSPYADRAPIGTEDSLRSYTAEGLRRFYDDWYRPELMGVVVVGDVDTERVKATIEKEFSGLASRGAAPERIRPLLPEFKKARATVLARKDAPSTEVSITSHIYDVEVSTLRGYREWLVGLTVQDAVEDRLRVLNRDSEGAVVRTSLGAGRLTPQASAWSVSAVSPSPDRALDALFALGVEIDRLRTHGISDTELVRSRRQMQTYQKQVASRAAGGATPSVELADELVRHYLTDEPAPDFEKMARLAIELLDEVTVQEANAWLHTHLLPESNRVVQLVVNGESGPTPEEVLQTYESSFEGEPGQFYDVNVDLPLVTTPPEPGSIVSEEAVDGVDAVRWTLENGAVVYFKRHELQPDRVLLFADSPGGSALEAPHAALLALPTARSSGMADHEPVIVAKILSGRDVTVAGYLRPMSEGFTGEAGVDEIEALFQLPWMRLSQSRFDPDALVRARRYIVQALEQQRRVQDNVVQQTALEAYWNGHPAYAMPTNADLEAVTAEQTKDALLARYASVHDWTFVIVGDTTKDKVRPLVERWIASLKGVEGPDETLDSTLTHPEGVVTERIEREGLDRGWVIMRLHHPLPDMAPERRAQLDALSGVLMVRLREALREELGGTYVPGVSGSFERTPSPRWVNTIWFACDPARVDEMRAAVSKELTALRDNGPTEAEVATQLQLRRRNAEELVRSGWYWSQGLMEAEQTGVPLDQWLDNEGHTQSITTDSLKALAAVHLQEDSVVEVLLAAPASAP
ncbi:MAG: M16 family metallopeptidase [Myxococcota bacterium]